MFYSSLKFRYQDTCVTPKGPNFRFAQTKSTVINGNKLSISVPRHKTKFSSEPCNPRRTYDLYSENFDFYRHLNKKWEALGILFRLWDFYGPNFIGRIGSVKLHMYILKNTEQKNNLSLFHPQVFENTVTEFLTEHYCEHEPRFEKSDPFIWDYKAPEDWQRINISDQWAAKFEIKDILRDDPAEKEFLVWIPIENHHILSLSFSISRQMNFVNDAPMDEWINPEPMLTLIDQVINSISIELSEESKQQKSDALKNVENPNISEHFPPIQWPEDDVLQKRIDPFTEDP